MNIEIHGRPDIAVTKDKLEGFNLAGLGDLGSHCVAEAMRGGLETKAMTESFEESGHLGFIHY